MVEERLSELEIGTEEFIKGIRKGMSKRMFSCLHASMYCLLVLYSAFSRFSLKVSLMLSFLSRGHWRCMELEKVRSVNESTHRECKIYQQPCSFGLIVIFSRPFNQGNQSPEDFLPAPKASYRQCIPSLHSLCRCACSLPAPQFQQSCHWLCRPKPSVSDQPLPTCSLEGVILLAHLWHSPKSKF